MLSRDRAVDATYVTPANDITDTCVLGALDQELL